MPACVARPRRALAALVVGIVLAAFGCAGAPPGPETTMPEAISPEAVRAIDIALQSLKERMDTLRTGDFPEQVVSLYGSPSSIRRKIEKRSRLDIRHPATEVVLLTMYIYDLYDLAVKADPELASHPREAIYGRAHLAGLTPELHFMFVDGRLHTVGDHELF